MTVAPRQAGWRWDAYDVWRRLVRNNPVHVTDPSSSTGRMARRNAKAFWASIAELPDPLQDALFVIAHARGFEAALAALDQAIREHLSARRRHADVVRLTVPALADDRGARPPIRRAAS
jgi:hypothetical protein